MQIFFISRTPDKLQNKPLQLLQNANLEAVCIHIATALVGRTHAKNTNPLLIHCERYTVRAVLFRIQAIE